MKYSEEAILAELEFWGLEGAPPWYAISDFDLYFIGWWNRWRLEEMGIFL